MGTLIAIREWRKQSIILGLKAKNEVIKERKAWHIRFAFIVCIQGVPNGIVFNHKI